MDEDFYEDPAHYNYYRNGPTDHGTFIEGCARSMRRPSMGRSVLVKQRNDLPRVTGKK